MARSVEAMGLARAMPVSENPVSFNPCILEAVSGVDRLTREDASGEENEVGELHYG